MRNWLSKHSTEIKLFAVIWLVYGAHVWPAGGSLPNRYVDMIHSIVNEQRFEIDTYHENTADSAYFNGHYYNGALPGPAFAGVPAYVVFKAAYRFVPNSIKANPANVQSYKKEKDPKSGFYNSVDNVEFFLSHIFLTLMVVAVISALGSVMLYKTVRILGYTAGIGVLVSLFYAVGTNIFFYSTSYAHHAMSATLGIAALYMLVRLRDRGTKSSSSVFLIGLLAGCGMPIEYSAIILVAAFGIWLFFLVEKRQLVYYVLGVLPPCLMLLAYNWAVFGSPLASSYSHLAENSAFHSTGFFGFTYPHPSWFFSLLLGKKAGLFVFAPILFVGAAGILYRIIVRTKDASVAWVGGLVAFGYVLFYSCYDMWSGGSVFGPRFLIPALPFLFIGVAFASDFCPRWFIYLFGAISILISWAGVQFGFATSPMDGVHNLLAKGPSLPIFDTVLTHSTNHESALYVFVAQYHGLMTSLVALGLVAVSILVLRYRPSSETALTGALELAESNS